MQTSKVILVQVLTKKILKFTLTRLSPIVQSSAIDIQYTSERGRFGVASRDIQVGEPLIFEAPTASKIKTNIYQDHCDRIKVEM